MSNKYLNVIEIINRIKLSQDQLLKIGFAVDNCDVWSAISTKLKLEELDESTLLNLGNRANNPYIWEKIIKTKKLSEKNLLDIINNNDIHYSTKILAIKTGPISKENLLLIGNTKKSMHFWNAIIKTNKLSSEEMCTIGENFSVWREIIQTNKLSKEKLIDIGIKEDNVFIWEEVKKALEFIQSQEPMKVPNPRQDK